MPGALGLFPQVFVEFVGTLFLCLAVVPFNGPVEVGLMLGAMIFAGGHISGGHYNPIVTLASAIVHKSDRRKALPFVVAQIAGAVGAAIIEIGFDRGFAKHDAQFGDNWLETCLFEALGTFALVFVVVLSSSHPTQAAAGVAIGGVVIALASTCAAGHSAARRALGSFSCSLSLSLCVCSPGLHGAPL